MINYENNEDVFIIQYPEEYFLLFLFLFLFFVNAVQTLVPYAPCGTQSIGTQNYLWATNNLLNFIFCTTVWLLWTWFCWNLMLVTRHWHSFFCPNQHFHLQLMLDMGGICHNLLTITEHKVGLQRYTGTSCNDTNIVYWTSYCDIYN